MPASDRRAFGRRAWRLAFRDARGLTARAMKPHEAGPLHPSAELIELLALCEALGERIPASPSLDLAAVRAVEEELGARLPDDALAMIAVRGTMLRCATNLALEELLDVAEDWSEG